MNPKPSPGVAAGAEDTSAVVAPSFVRTRSSRTLSPGDRRPAPAGRDREGWGEGEHLHLSHEEKMRPRASVPKLVIPGVSAE